jgi:hypothetical protein
VALTTLLGIGGAILAIAFLGTAVAVRLRRSSAACPAPPRLDAGARQ